MHFTDPNALFSLYGVHASEEIRPFYKKFKKKREYIETLKDRLRITSHKSILHSLGPNLVANTSLMLIMKVIFLV